MQAYVPVNDYLAELGEALLLKQLKRTSEKIITVQSSHSAKSRAVRGSLKVQS